MPQGRRRSEAASSDVTPSSLDHAFGEDLTRSWRRVASTHALQSLIAPDTTAKHPKSRAITLKGLLLLAAAVTLVALHIAHAAALWLPPSLLPPLLKSMREHSQLLFQVAFTFHGTAIAVFLHWFSLKLFKHNSS
ncbi:hypothetical protein PLESTB_000544500 [Pleodorina starrii]|uniref:Uncharacterized protein n=1 Tax=Pleodorina starrii TaxID=330485 RepID=A0A9W6BHS6_9CHLO|nr:hypothetical protein PLESTB_000544500 [Pleodorina starrii]